MLDLKKGVEPRSQPLRRRTFDALAFEGHGDLVEPGADDGFAQGNFGGKEPVDGSVADAQRLSHIDHGRLGGTMATDDLLGGMEDLFSGEPARGGGSVGI